MKAAGYALISILMKWNAPFALLIVILASTIYKSTASTSGGSSASSGGSGDGSGAIISGSINGSQAACAACKYQRRKCTPECIFAPYFPADQPRMFRNAHRLFGVSNIMKILKKVPREQWDDAMASIKYQSDMWERFPGQGCVRVLSLLRERIAETRSHLIYINSLLKMVRNQHHQTTNNGGMYNANDVGWTIQPNVGQSTDQSGFYSNNYLMQMPQMESLNLNHGGGSLDNYNNYQYSQQPLLGGNESMNSVRREHPVLVNYDNGGFEGVAGGSSSSNSFYRVNSQNIMGLIKMDNDDQRRYINPYHLSKDDNISPYQEISQPHGDQAAMNFHQLDCRDMFLEPKLAEDRQSEDDSS